MEKNNFKYNDIWKYPLTGILNLTDSCNLACHYCFVQQQPHFMTYEIAKDSIDWLCQNYIIKKEKNILNKDSNVGIQFFGGEPMLLYDDIIVPIMYYIEKKYTNIPFNIGITTNGTLLNEERIKFLKKHHVGILLSIDGDKTTQDLTRPCRNGQSSFDLVIQNIPNILKYYPQTTFRATVSQENVKQLFHNFLFAEAIGFKQCFFSINEREEWTEENLLIAEQEVSKIFQYYMILLQNNIMPILTSSLIIDSFKIALLLYDSIINKTKLIIDNKLDSSICGIGIQHISINFKGDLFTCQEQDSRNNTNDIFNIGNIYTGINKNKHIQLLNSIYNNNNNIIQCNDLNICKTCKTKIKCKEWICPSTNNDLFNKINMKSKISCRYRNAYVNNALTLLQLLGNNKFFINYLQFLINKEDIGYYANK